MTQNITTLNYFCVKCRNKCVVKQKNCFLNLSTQEVALKYICNCIFV